MRAPLDDGGPQACEDGLLTAPPAGLWAAGIITSLPLFAGALFAPLAGPLALPLAAPLFLASAAYLFGYRWFYRGATAPERIWPEAGVIRLWALMYVSPLLTS